MPNLKIINIFTFSGERSSGGANTNNMNGKANGPPVAEENVNLGFVGDTDTDGFTMNSIDNLDVNSHDVIFPPLFSQELA